MARNKKVEILSNDKEVLHPMTDGDCVIFEDGQTLAQKLSEDDSVKYTPEIVNSSPMFKVGEGNVVDYSDNVLDGAYERAILQGQTYVNYIQESSADEVTLPTPFTEYERTQHNTLTSDEEGTLGINLVGQSYVNALQHDSEEEFVVLGESLEFQEKKVEYTNEGQIKSAMLKGQTLVNLCKTPSSFLTMTSSAQSINLNIVHNLQPNKTYAIIGEVSEINAPNKGLCTWATHVDGTEAYGMKGVTDAGKFFFTYNVTKEITTFRVYIHGDDRDNGGTITIGNLMLIEYQEGMENWDIPYFQGMQSVTVSTRLENKLGTCTTTLSTNPKTGKTFTTNDGSTRSLYLANNSSQLGLKPNTKYIVGFKVSNLVLDGLSMVTLMLNVDSTNKLFEHPNGNGSTIYVDKNGVYRFVMKTTNTIESATALIKGIAEEWENSGSSLRSMTISEIMYVEYQNGMENWNLPYFEDYQVMKPVQIESINKNLFDGELEVGTIATSDGTNVNASAYNQYCRTKNYIKVQPSTSYNIVYDIDYGNTLFYFYSSDKAYITNSHTTTVNDGTNTGKVTTPNNCEYIKFRFVNNSELVNDKKIMLEESSTATSYVPHQSKTTYSWDEVILRKIGDVEDTLDLTTGEWVQRIGEATITGYENHYWYYGQPSSGWNQDGDAKAFYSHDASRELFKNKKFNGKCNCAKMCVMVDGERMVNDLLNHDTFALGHTDYVVIRKTGISTLEEFKAWLQQNPITIQYELDTPIVHKVNLSRPNLQVYDDITHVHTKCLDGTLIPNIYLPSDISYPAILEPGKKYNVCVNQTEVSADNPLKVNVGGTEITMTDSRMTLTTPATLANNNVSFTGKGNKIKESMLIKNSSLLTRDLPHFNGIGSVQLGKTIENLCSSSGFKAGSSDAKITWYDNYAHTNISAGAGSCVFVYELVKRLENGKKYFVYSPINLTGYNRAVSFRNLYNNTLIYSKQATQIDSTYKNIIEINQEENFYTHVVVGCHYTMQLNTEFDTYRPIICEYEPGMEDWDWESIGYFTGTKNIGNEFMRVQNKNLVDTSKIVQGVTYNDGGFSTTSEFGGRLTLRQKDAILVKPNSVYSVSISPSDFTMGYYLLDKDKNIIYDSGWLPNSASFLINRPNAKYLIFNLKKQSGEKIEVSDVTSIQIEESSTATTYTAHKHNGLYITKDQPIELTWEQGNVNATANTSWNDAIQNTISKRIRTNLITLKPNTSYRVSLGNKNYMWYLYAFDGNNVCPQARSFNLKPDGFMQTDFIFTTTQQLYKIALVGRKVDDTPITPSEINHIRLEEVTDVVLRGIGDVHDELDITRGIYTQRIGEITYDGSEYFDTSKDYFWYVNLNISNENYMTFMLDGRDGKPGSSNFVCDKLANKPTWLTVETGIWADSAIVLTLPTSIATNTLQLKEYLQINQLRIQYQLATPIVHKVHIGNKNETNTEVAKPNDVFTLPTLYTEQTHIDLTNNGIMPKVQSRDYIAYPVLPMVSRTYTLQHNLTGGVSNLTVDLLGRTQSVSYQNHKSLVYTPETMDAILHNELRISGKGKISRVMYIDGGYMDRDIPYIEGMKNAVNPIVKNVGKNLVQKIDNIWYFYDNIINYGGTSHNCGIAPIKPHTQYIINKDSILCFYDENGKCTNSPFQYFNANSPRTAPSGSKYMLVRHNGGDNATYLDGLQVVEYGQEFDNQEYKENICYVDCGEIRLTPDMFEQGNFGSDASKTYEENKNNGANRYRTKSLIKVEPNTTYKIRHTEYYSAVYEYGKDEKKLTLGYNINKSTLTITTSNNCYYLAFSFVTSTLPTQYVSITKVSEIKQMRSLPNGVRDEIDLETGKYIQRIGEMTLNDNDYIIDYFAAESVNGYSLFAFVKSDIKNAIDEHDKTQALCDKLVYENVWSTKDKEGFFISNDRHRVFIRISNDKLSAQSVDALNEYLSSNPIKVQYQLETPIIKQVGIHNYPHSYEGGHVIIESGDPNAPIPAQLTYRAVTNRSGQIQQHTEQVEKQEREINELETLILANIHLSQTR